MVHRCHYVHTGKERRSELNSLGAAVSDEGEGEEEGEEGAEEEGEGGRGGGGGGNKSGVGSGEARKEDKGSAVGGRKRRGEKDPKVPPMKIKLIGRTGESDSPIFFAESLGEVRRVIIKSKAVSWDSCVFANCLGLVH